MNNSLSPVYSLLLFFCLRDFIYFFFLFFRRWWTKSKTLDDTARSFVNIIAPKINRSNHIKRYNNTERPIISEWQQWRCEWDEWYQWNKWCKWSYWEWQWSHQWYINSRTRRSPRRLRISANTTHSI